MILIPASLKKPPSIPISPNSFSISTTFLPENDSAISFLIRVVFLHPKNLKWCLFLSLNSSPFSARSLPGFPGAGSERFLLISFTAWEQWHLALIPNSYILMTFPCFVNRHGRNTARRLPLHSDRTWIPYAEVHRNKKHSETGSFWDPRNKIILKLPETGYTEACPPWHFVVK